MTDLQAEKKLVLDYFNEIDSCNIDSLSEVISKYASEDFSMKCTHPFNELGSIDLLLIIFGSQLKIHFHLYNVD